MVGNTGQLYKALKRDKAFITKNGLSGETLTQPTDVLKKSTEGTFALRLQ